MRRNRLCHSLRLLLYVVRDSMISGAQSSATEIHVRMAGNLIAQFQAAEKAGAQPGRSSAPGGTSHSRHALLGWRLHVSAQLFWLIYCALDKRKEGKTDGGGTLSDGRTPMQGYRDVLANSDFGYVSLYTKRVNRNVDVPKSTAC